MLNLSFFQRAYLLICSLFEWSLALCVPTAVVRSPQDAWMSQTHIETQISLTHTQTQDRQLHTGKHTIKLIAQNSGRVLESKQRHTFSNSKLRLWGASPRWVIYYSELNAHWHFMLLAILLTCDGDYRFPSGASLWALLPPAGPSLKCQSQA